MQFHQAIKAGPQVVISSHVSLLSSVLGGGVHICLLNVYRKYTYQFFDFIFEAVICLSEDGNNVVHLFFFFCMILVSFH